MKTKVLITLTLCVLAFPAKGQRNTPISSSIRTLRTFVAERPTAPPIIELNGDEHIAVEFDHLTHEYHRFLYRIEHCDADWNVSEDLFESDYISGNNGEEPIDQEAQSLNTMQQYTHYALRLPNNGSISPWPETTGSPSLMTLRASRVRWRKPSSRW